MTPAYAAVALNVLSLVLIYLGCWRKSDLALLASFTLPLVTLCVLMKYARWLLWL